jgi:two-component system, OmpR family, response regulator ResD
MIIVVLFLILIVIIFLILIYIFLLAQICRMEFNMYKILVVDDEPKIRELIKKYAVFEGHEIVEAGDGMKAIELANSQDFDIIILDIMMPELDGFSACREIRKTKNTPILMLSARGEEYDRIHGFELKIDDYVVKPFSPKELMMRIDAIIRRSKNTTDIDFKEIETFDELTVDFTGRLVCINGARVNLSPKEYDLLFYMVKNKDRALTREKLITNVWGYDFFGDDRTLDTHIKLLRRSLGDCSRLIVTLRGVGYRFDTQETKH